LWLATRRFKRELKTRDGLTLVRSLVALRPSRHALCITADQLHAGLLRSGIRLTTTGARAVGLELLPRSINLWRHLLSCSAAWNHRARRGRAAAPRIGGMQIYRAEMPGP